MCYMKNIYQLHTQHQNNCASKSRGKHKIKLQIKSILASEWLNTPMIEII